MRRNLGLRIGHRRRRGRRRRSGTSTRRASRINLGLDLQGGIHLVLGVDVARLWRPRSSGRGTASAPSSRGRASRSPRSSGAGSTDLVDPDRLTPELGRRAGHRRRGAGQLRSQGGGPGRGPRRDGAQAARGGPDPRVAVRQGLETIRNRIDQFGVAEPSIQQQGDNRILVQLPGVQDPERAKALIGKTALLEFKLVDDKIDPEHRAQERGAGRRRDPLPAPGRQGDPARSARSPSSCRRRPT